MHSNLWQKMFVGNNIKKITALHTFAIRKVMFLLFKIHTWCFALVFKHGLFKALFASS